MAKVRSIIIPKVIRALQLSVEKAFVEIGSEGINKLKEEESLSDVTHRLSDSFSWASNKRSSGIGPNAESSDEVPKPTTPYTMLLGTQTPYCDSVNSGTLGTFQYGVNGAPANFDELLKEIRKWLRAKIANGQFSIDGETREHDLAFRIAKSIEETGTDAHPYWEESMLFVKSMAPDILQAAIDSELAKIPNATQTVKAGVR